MEKKEIEQQFKQRYDEIIESRDERQMERLGAMVKRVMAWITRNVPELAEQALAMLDEETRNQLTIQEAHDIVTRMDPRPQWSIAQLEDTLTQMNLTVEEPPYFNRWALLTTMLMIQSDEGDTLSKMMNTSKSSERMVTVIYQLALCRLKDLDGRFNIRKYFDLDKKPE